MTIDDLIEERVAELRDTAIITEAEALKFVMETVKAVGQYLIKEAGRKGEVR